MDTATKRKLLIGTIGEIVQQFLPTKILDTLETLNENVGNNETANDLEEEKFIQELLLANRQCETTSNIDLTEDCESVQNAESLTYYDIIEQEILSSLIVSKRNIRHFVKQLEKFGDLSSISIAQFNLQSVDQLINLAIFTLMSPDDFKSIEQHFFLDPGIVERILHKFCGIVADVKEKFIRWPTKCEIERSRIQFERLTEFGRFEFYNVFGAIGTTDISIMPPLKDFLLVPSSDGAYTPIKLQCCCNANGLLQSSFVFIPKQESDTKNSNVFEANPTKVNIESMESDDEIYVVGDETLTLCPILMTPHDKIVVHSDQFNKALESKRKIIDKVFDRMWIHFPILNRIELRDAKRITELIETICILHNFFTTNRDPGYLQKRK